MFSVDGVVPIGAEALTRLVRIPAFPSPGAARSGPAPSAPPHPRAYSDAISVSRTSRRSTFPISDRGSSSTATIRRGTLYAASRVRQ